MVTSPTTNEQRPAARTECSVHEFRFEAPGHRELVARFDGGTISSDGGELLLAETEQRTQILERFAAHKPKLLKRISGTGH